MKHNKVILAACSLLLLFSCATTRQASGVKVSKIREFAYIKPCAYMVFYEDDGAGYYNQTNSDLASDVIANVINAERFPFTEMIPADYQGDNNDIFLWARNLTDIQTAQVDRIRVPKTLLSLISDSGQRYGILIYSYGYTMSVKAYEKERYQKAASKVIDTAVEKLTGIGGLTNPSRTHIPSDPYGNEMSCVVVDAEEQRVVYYRKQTPAFASHPRDNEDVSKLLHKLLKDHETFQSPYPGLCRRPPAGRLHR